MEKKKRLTICQLEAILASDQSDGYLKQAAREKLARLMPRVKKLHIKTGSMLALI